RCDALVLVSTGTVAAVTAASRVAARLPETVPQWLVVRHGRGSVAAAEVSRLVGIPLLCGMNPQRGLDEAIDLGAGPARSGRGALARAAGTSLSLLAGEVVAA